VNLQALSLPAIGLLVLTSASLLVIRDWRIRIILLALQYVGVFVLVAISWPVVMALTKVLAGWMAGAILGMAVAGIPQLGPAAMISTAVPGEGDRVYPIGSGRFFHIFYLPVALLVLLAAFSLAPTAQSWIPGLTLEQALGSFLLIFMGTIQLCFAVRPFGTLIGLLTALSGFEILYAAVESSILVAGFLAGITLGLALIGAYLIVAPYIESPE